MDNKTQTGSGLFRTFRQLFSLRCTTKTNMLIYAIRQIPLIKHLLPGDLYAAEGFKVMAYILVLIWEVIMTFLVKFLAFGGAVMLPLIPLTEIANEKNALLLQMILFYTLFGGIIRTNFFMSDNKAEVAIKLLRMDARDYTLATFFYFLLRLTVGYLPLILIFGLAVHVPWWICLLLPFAFAGTKLVFARLEIAMNETVGITFSDKKATWFTLPALVIMLGCVYLLPMFKLVLPMYVSAGILLAMIPLGVLCIKPLLRYRGYKDVTVRLIEVAQSVVEQNKNMQKNAMRKQISKDAAKATSNRSGFEYLNELFIKRHKSILWSATVKITIAALVVAALCIVLVIRVPSFSDNINEWIMRGLPVLPFILYGINRGTSFTQALFMNCDHSLLTYPFFKKPKSILALFRIRLREIMKINSVPAAVLGIGLAVLLAITGGTDNPINYAVVLLSPIALSMFFSVHYLMLYYLLQPYTAGSEMKNGLYGFITGATYAVCYFMMRLQLPTLAFGITCIAFCVIYSVVACVLVYKFAYKTFKLRAG